MKSIRRLRLVLSLLLILSVATILMHLQEVRPGFSAFNFFSYFTNQSNLLVALFFGVEAWRHWRGKPLSRSFYDRTRGGLILYMSMTTSIYWLFLHHLVHFSSPAAAAANNFLHIGGLAFLLFDWFWDRPQTRMEKRFFVIWLIYPLIYGITIMLLGRIRTWYPYPFLNIDRLGAGSWALWNGIMAVGIGLLSVAIILINNRLSRDTVQNSVRV